MSKLITFAVLATVAAPAFAVPQELPIPSVLPLLGIGFLAVVAARHFRK